MSTPLEDYVLIGDMASCALVGRDGSIDWLCVPRFDSDACFAALLGGPEHGRWLIGPATDATRTSRRYRDGTPILETTFETNTGAFTVTDFMPVSEHPGRLQLVRIVTGMRGHAAVNMEFILRPGYGRTIPWVQRRDYGLRIVAGPDTFDLDTPVELTGKNLTTRAEFAVTEGQIIPFTLAYHPSHFEPGFVDDRRVMLDRTERWWRQWSAQCDLPEDMPKDWCEAVTRSLITLKTLTFRNSGGIVAAPTTSLPERLGGDRNWDYRYCWLRDATITLFGLLNAGYFGEAQQFRHWLLRAIAGHPDQLQIMYGLAGERRIPEVELEWLPGYENSKPVRIGNAAHSQLQLDVYGELLDALHTARRSHLGPHEAAWQLQRLMLEKLEKSWREPDAGIWESRGDPQHFTYSKIMCWVAFDRCIKAVEEMNLEGDANRWRRIRDEIRDDVMMRGYSLERNAFVQVYGGAGVDASLLRIAEMGFIAPNDPRFRGTVAAIKEDLVEDGFVRRYHTDRTDDGVGGAEGTFLICSFWLADALILLGERDEAAEIFERLLDVRNDVGLLAEEYDPVGRRMLGNFPQAFSHVGLVNTAYNLMRSGGPARQRFHDATPPTADLPPSPELEYFDDTT